MRKSLLGLAVVLGFGFLSLGFVVLLSQAAPELPRAPFDARAFNRLKKRPASVVLIGNSMVYTRFDPGLLSELIRPARVEVIAVGGSKTAVWYAKLKHTVVASGARPSVIVFFRDRELTQFSKGDGREGERLEQAVPGRDLVLERKLDVRLASDARFGAVLDEIAPVERLRARSWSYVDGFASWFSSVLVGGPPAESRKQRINALFGVEALRPEPEKAAGADEQTDDATNVFESSLLPEMLELPRTNDIPLTFARVRTRRHAMGLPDPPSRLRYLRELRAFLEGRGAAYLDLTENEWETLALFANGDHLARRHRAAYTRRFVREYPELFGLPP